MGWGMPPIDDPLTEPQAIQWALRIGEHVRSDKQQRDAHYWCKALGLGERQTAQILLFFEELEE